MNIPSPWDELAVEDFPKGVLRMIAERHGPRVAADIWKRGKGVRCEIPLRFTRDIKLRYIRNHFDGTNAAEVARRLDVTEKFVRDSLNEKLPPAPPASTQLSLI